jgi:hypothetical protein
VALAGGGVALAVLAVVAWMTGSTPPGVAADPSSTARPTVGASEEPSTAPDGDWTALELEPYEPMAELAADTTDGFGIDPAGSFTFHSLTSVPAVELAAGLVAEPATDLSIQPGAAPDVATIRPAEPLHENTRYQIQLRDPDGALAGSWSFRTGGPLVVVRHLPDDQSQQVPVDTGIEIEFNQDGAADVSAHFSIDPQVAGAFETHGRSWVFVPSSPLADATLYTVTLTAGVGLDGSARTMETDLRFAFETTADSRASEPMILFEQPVHEVRPDEAPVIPIDVVLNPDEAESTTRRVVVYGLPTLEEVLSAAEILGVDRGWALWSSNGNVPTDQLAEAATFEASVDLQYPSEHLRLPTGLAAGWYLLEVDQEGGRNAQQILQVTDLAAYVLTSETRTIAWVNDLALDAPITGADVAVAGGSGIGRTDGEGLLDVTTPASLLPDADADPQQRLLVVAAPDGRRLIAPLGSADGTYWFRRAASSTWWLLFGTDRTQYRTDDTIRAWGLIRSRADRSVPDDLELRLVHVGDPGGPPIERVPITATARGMLAGEIPVSGVPPGSYLAALYAGGESVASVWLEVTTIRKPSFQVDVATDRRAYIAGDPIEASVGTRFFDGSAAPGLRLRVSASGVGRDGDEQVVTAGTSGAAELTFTAATSGPTQDVGHVNAGPAQPEEGSSYGSTSFAVFPSTAWLDAEAAVDVGSLAISGHLSRVDLDAADAEMAANGWVEDPAGAPMPNRVIDVEVDRVTWVPVQTGTTYDFLLKRSVPEYRYDRVVTPIGTFRPSSGSDGSFALSVPVGDETDGIEVRLSAVDEEGRRIDLQLWADVRGGQQPPAATTVPYLEVPSWCGGATQSASLGTDVTLTVRSGDGSPDATGRTLFVVARGGIDDVVVTSAAALERTFADADLPSLTVRAVRVTPAGYVETNDAQVFAAEEDTRLDVAVQADFARYAPGEEVTLAITTRLPNGSPIAADVVVQAVDLKLFAIGAAQEVDTSALMHGVGTGFLGSYASHRLPTPIGDCGFGATTGGGEPRDEFEDLATFQLITTDGDGRGTATFEVPDDLTSWVVSAAAVSDGLRSGTHSIEVPVGLPFFVDATIAPEYLAGEEPMLQLRAYGDALSAGDAVTFTLDAPSLGVDESTLTGAAFEPAWIALPALPLGSHEVTISASHAGAGTELRDAIVRTVRVVPTRLQTQQTLYTELTDRLQPSGGDGLTTYVITDAGRGALLPVLHQLAWGSSARFDAALAAELARRILVEDFAVLETDLPASGFSGAGGHPAGGLAPLPYASADLSLTAKAALVAPDQLSADHIRQALTTVVENDGSRERRIIALAGLAGIGEDVLADLQAIDSEELSVRERAWLGLGLMAGGDEAGARVIERSILADHGQRLGRWVRLDFGPLTPESAETAGSMLLLAAGLRDPIAMDLSRYLLEHPSTEYLASLDQIGFARAAIDWLPRAEARFAWTVDGERTEQTLERGTAATLTLTAAQREQFTLERLDGQILVASTWAAEADYDELPSDPSITVERSVTPPDFSPSDVLVRVILDVTFDGSGLAGCYQVTDLLPSGLAPVVEPLYGWGDHDPNVIAPYEVEGQRVSWCVPDDKPSLRLGYTARVVSAGTYRWEPAVVQSPNATAIGSATGVATYTIGEHR